MGDSTRPAAGDQKDAPARAHDDDPASSDNTATVTVATNNSNSSIVISGAPCRIEIGTTLGVYTSFEEQLILRAAMAVTTRSFLATINRLFLVRRLARFSLSRSRRLRAGGAAHGAVVCASP